MLGDRTETLFCSTLALIHNIKIAHLHGGEVTKGAIDNEIRNAISQISNIHFVSHKEYKKNLINLYMSTNSTDTSDEILFPFEIPNNYRKIKF